MYSYKLFIIASLILGILAACSQPNSQPAPSGTALPEPAADKSTLQGQAVTNTDQAPIKQTIVRLARVYRGADSEEAVFALDLAQSPATFTDDQGFFAFTDIAPGQYVINVGDYYGENDIVREDNGDAHVFDAQGGQVLNVGAVQVKPNVSPGK